jgi:hypothetical protein
MRKTTFLVYLSLLSTFAFTQVENISKDSLIVINEYVYDLDYGISMFHRYCPSQKTFNKEGVLLREINYTKGEVSNYNMDAIIYFYYNKDGRLHSKEYYTTNADLKYLIVYDYNEITGDTLRISKGIIQDNSFVISDDIKYKYKKNKLVQVKHYNHNKDLLSKTEVINQDSVQLYKKTFSKIALETDSITYQESIFSYQNNLLANKLIINHYTNLRTDTTRYSYTYQNNLISNSAYYQNSALINSTETTYYPEGGVKTITVFNADKKKIAFSAFETSYLLRQFGGLNSAYPNTKK